MKKTITKPTQADAFELGNILGQRRALSNIAGACSAAEAASLKKIRDEKLYLGRSKDWRQFCKEHLRMSRSTADKIIGQLNEFGPEFFAVTQLMKITPEHYRAIASSFHDNAVHFMGEAIALLPENSGKVEAAVDELQKNAAAPPPRSKPQPSKPAVAEDPEPTLEEIEERGRRLVSDLDYLATWACAEELEPLAGVVEQLSNDLEALRLRVAD
jgi:hypothetical protein